MKNKYIVLAALSVLLLTVTSCSQDEGNVEVKLTSSALPLIPGTATSCLTQKLTPDNILPRRDIESDYVTVPKLTFARKDRKNTLIITLVRFTIDIPGMGKYVRSFGGDELAALSSKWYSSTGSNEAVIGPNETENFVTDCSIRLGGITMDRGLAASGIVEIMGLERAADDSETPVRTQSVILIESP